MNPFTPPEPQKYVCDKCKQESERLGVTGALIGWVIVMLIVFLAAHGLMTILKQHGIVLSTVYGEEFWFENEIRKMLWRQ